MIALILTLVARFLSLLRLRLKEKGHTLMKNHLQESIPDGKHFNYEYLSEVIKKNIPDFVYYIED
jgi:hypothetical protein